MLFNYDMGFSSMSYELLWPHGQAVKTSPSQGGITGSIPVGATKALNKLVYRVCRLAYFLFSHISFRKL